MATRHNILLDAAVIAAPLLLVLGVRVLFSPSPAASSVGTAAVSMPAFTPVVARNVSPEQQRAAEWIKSITSSSGLRSPMAHPIPAPQVVVAAPAAPEVEPPPPPDDPIGGLRLTGILGNTDGGLAAINGKVYKVGDLVRPGVTLGAIDARNNTVTFRLPDGSEVKLARKAEPLGG